jgi:hypothetical protein
MKVFSSSSSFCRSRGTAHQPVNTNDDIENTNDGTAIHSNDIDNNNRTTSTASAGSSTRKAASVARYRNARTVDMVIRAFEERTKETAEQSAVRRAEERPSCFRSINLWYQRNFHHIALIIACIYPPLELFFIWRLALRLKQGWFTPLTVVSAASTQIATLFTLSSLVLWYDG